MAVLVGTQLLLATLAEVQLILALALLRTATSMLEGRLLLKKKNVLLSRNMTYLLLVQPFFTFM
jgi:hypothetical protein